MHDTGRVQNATVAPFGRYNTMENYATSILLLRPANRLKLSCIIGAVGELVLLDQQHNQRTRYEAPFYSYFILPDWRPAPAAKVIPTSDAVPPVRRCRKARTRRKR